MAARRINADATAATLDRIVARRGTAPGYIRCDNGPELTANALRDWCRFSGTAQQLHRGPVRRGKTHSSSRSTAGCATSSLAVEQVRQPARGAGAHRGLADRVQHEAPAQQPGLARPGCLRRALGDSATRWTLISGGLAKGVRSLEEGFLLEGAVDFEATGIIESWLPLLLFSLLFRALDRPTRCS